MLWYTQKKFVDRGIVCAMLFFRTLVHHWLDWGAGHCPVHCCGTNVDCIDVGASMKEARVVPKSTPL